MTTLNSTGGPQVTVVWVGIEGEDFVIGHLHLPTYQKVKNIRRDPRVALSMLSDATNAQGLREYLVVYGDARVTEGGAFDLLQSLGRLYLGPNAVYPPAAIRNLPGWITRITPARFAGVGPWVVPTAHDNCWCFAALIKRPSQLKKLSFATTLALAVYAHLYAAFFFLAELTWLMCEWIQTQTLLGRFGYRSQLRIGVRKPEDGIFAAHAWLECAGTIVIGEFEPDQYVPLAPTNRRGSVA